MNQSTPLKRTSFTRKMPDNAIKPSPGIRKKKCANRACRESFVPLRPFEDHCSPECGEIIAQDRLTKQRLKKEKAERAADKKKLDGLKKYSHFADLTQTVVNKYVMTKYKDMPCICCGKSPYSGERHAGHFKSRGSSSFLAFHLWNIWPCCYSCNSKKGGNIHEYRPALINLIGIEKVEFLDCAPKSRRYSIEDLARMRRIFAKKTRRLKNI